MILLHSHEIDLAVVLDLQFSVLLVWLWEELVLAKQVVIVHEVYGVAIDIAELLPVRL